MGVYSRHPDLIIMRHWRCLRQDDFFNCLYKECPKDHKEIECITRDLEAICKDLETPRQPAAQDLDLGLSELIQKCKELSGTLLQEVRAVRKTSVQSSKWKSFKTALALVWNREKLENYKSRLSELRLQLVVHLQHRERKLLSDIQHEITVFKDQMNEQNTSHRHSLSQMEGYLKSHSNSTLSTDTTLEQLFGRLSRAIHEKEALRVERFLCSLRYDTMASRYLSISEAHRNTFQWIFQTDQLPISDTRSQIAFKEWLRSSTGIYWITGKPGSEKSTLMKYLSDHPETESALRQWATGSLVTAKFFFWNAGTSMQKSLHGLLQSLVYEILRKHPDWIPTLCPSHWTSAVPDLEAWTFPELKRILGDVARQGLDHGANEAIRQSIGSSKFCFFIDGLDEYGGDVEDVLDCLQDINRSVNIKLCLSSRPWNCFEDAFGRHRDRKLRLYLEELTRDDIGQFAYDKIISSLTRVNMDSFDEDLAEQLKEEITKKAQGVFLWVALAVSSLRRGISNGDSLGTLLQRLSTFPSELKDFFKHIIDQVESVYRSKMACLFEVTLQRPGDLTLYAYFFLMEDDPDYCIKMVADKLPPHDFNQRRLLAQRRLEACCKGLLEIQPGQSNSPEASIGRTWNFEEPFFVGAETYKTKDMKLVPHEMVGFLHRTVRDYLVHEDQSWKQRIPEGFCPYAAVVRAQLGNLKSTSTTAQEKPNKVKQAHEIALQNGKKGDPEAMEELERLLSVNYFWELTWQKRSWNSQLCESPSKSCEGLEWEDESGGKKKHLKPS